MISITSKGSNDSVFLPKQSFQSSVNKVEKHLPKSTRKKCEVIIGLANKYKFRLQFAKNGRKAKVLNEEQFVYLQFFERPDITYTNPGREGNVQVGVIHREKIFPQKQHLFRAAKNRK